MDFDAAAGAKIGGTLGAALSAGDGSDSSTCNNAYRTVTGIVGKTVNKIEEGVGKAFKSIGSWFK